MLELDGFSQKMESLHSWKLSCKNWECEGAPVLSRVLVGMAREEKKDILFGMLVPRQLLYLTTTCRCEVPTSGGSNSYGERPRIGYIVGWTWGHHSSRYIARQAQARFIDNV